MEICYIPKKFSLRSQQKITIANEIIAEYKEEGYSLTLRQLYYQFVARDYIANTQREYKNLGSVINDGRLAGMIDWDAIQDRTRFVRSLSHWGGPWEIVHSCVNQFQLDRWKDQEYRLEVWIEKDALVGVIESICQEFDVPFFSCRGYVSQSEMWGASQRMLDYARAGQKPVIIHLGDHDPSGVDMTRDIRDRLFMFMEVEDFTVDRIALNMDQIDQYKPPPNPAKITDSRAKQYIAEFGDESWELDALEPRVMNDMIRDKFMEFINMRAWKLTIAQEKEYKAQLATVAESMEEKK